MKPERNIGWWVDRVFMYLFVWIPATVLCLSGIVIIIAQIVIWLKTGEWISADLKDVIPPRYFSWAYDKDTWWIMKKVGLFLLNCPVSLSAFICGYFLLNIRNREKGVDDNPEPYEE
ncbi:MAG: hypothetical protein HQ551_08800 [Desulfobacteraceae bacterium]|nr:hypothetical protein [Desulfobacteraceae bacterium]